jgi:ribosomal protein S12 methylthiotransferase accessory factor YcaO
MNSSSPKQDQEIDIYLRHRLQEFGITRLADTTGLDYVGIPTCSCVCPGTTDAIWVYSGKGVTPERSRISGIMECVERTSSLWSRERVIISDYSTLALKSLVWGPEKFTESLSPHYSPNEPSAWVKATHLWKNYSVWVPADLVFNGRRPQLEVPSAFRVSTSNGLGAGLSREQAIKQALGELIERDAVSCIEQRASHFGAAYILNLARFIGKDESSLLEQFRDNTDLALTLEPASLPPDAMTLYEGFRDAGLNVHIKYIPNDFNVPVFGAAAVEMMSFDSVLAAAGYGVSLNPAEAVCRALLELAQSRATDRQGVREDCGHEEKDRLSDIPSSHWLAEPGSKLIDYTNLFKEKKNKASTVDDFLVCLESAGLCDAAVVDFDTYEGIFVVRAIVPEIETWHATGGSSRLGQRMLRQFGR